MSMLYTLHFYCNQNFSHTLGEQQRSCRLVDIRATKRHDCLCYWEEDCTHPFWDDATARVCVGAEVGDEAFLSLVFFLLMCVQTTLN